MKYSSPIWTRGQTLGTAQLAPTAATKSTPLSRVKTWNVPVTALTAVTAIGRSGHSCSGSSAAI